MGCIEEFLAREDLMKVMPPTPPKAGSEPLKIAHPR
jgi:hypothetical protein